MLDRRPRPARGPPAHRGGLVRVRAEPRVVPDRGVLLPRLCHGAGDRVPASRPPTDPRPRAGHRRAQGACSGAGGRHMSSTIDVDIGGTFTDCYVTHGRERVWCKTRTTTYDLSVAMNETIEE